MAASPPSPEPLLPHRTPTSRSFSPISITPRSSDSSPAFFYHSTTTSDTSFDPVASSSNDLSTNVAATTHWLHRNVVQRVLSALFLMPLITVFLWLSPAFATATFCTFVTSICSYEYAWLHFRIYERISTKLNTSESRLTHRNATTDFSTARPEPLDNNRRSVNSCFSRNLRDENSRRSRSSRNSRSIVADDSDTRHEYGVNGGQERTGGSTTGETVVLSALGFPPQPQARFGPHVLEHLVNEQEEPSHVGNGINEEDDAHAEDAIFSRGAVTGLADRYFHQSEWIAAIVLSTLTTVCTTAVFLTYVNHVPELHEKQLYELRWFYSIATDFVGALCAFSTPDWTYACVCLVEKMIFTLLTMHSTACPINNFRCGTSLEPAQVFLAGVAIIVLLRRHTSSSGPSTFLHIALDVLGYVYIIGSLSVIVAFVDDERLESYRKLLIVLLYVVWASDTGAYITGKLLERIHYRHYNPLASHLSKNKDYEGTIGAILFGVTAMFISSDLLNVPGSAVAQIGFTVLAVIVGRLGDLFESLLKRAAGVKDSGKLIPGHGGVLDRIDALMFASLVFAQYYASIVV